MVGSPVEGGTLVISFGVLPCSEIVNFKQGNEAAIFFEKPFPCDEHRLFAETTQGRR